MREPKNETDYIILYGKARRQIKTLEQQLERLITKNQHEVALLRQELNKPRLKAAAKPTTIERLLLTVCDKTNTTAGQLMSPSRERNVVVARHLFFYIGRYDYNLNWSQLSGMLDRHHTSAIHGATQYANYINLGYAVECKLYKAVTTELNNIEL